jgi:hypothetical protein
MRTSLRQLGYGEKDSSRAGFSKWIGRQYTDLRVFQNAIRNGIAIVVAAILEDD